MNMQNWIQSVIKSEERLAIPLMTHPGIELAGENVISAVRDGNVHYQAIKMIAENFHPSVSVANIMMDLTVEAEAFGSKIYFSKDESPAVAERLVHDEESINSLKIPSLDSARIPEYIKASKLAVQNLNDKPVFAGCIGPFSLAGRLFDLSEIMTELFINPDAIKVLLQKSSTFLLDYIRAFKATGANGIVIAEPAAGLLSAEMCDEFSSVYVKDIISQVQDESFLCMLHNCGNTGHATQSMISTGAAALHFGNKINMVEALNEIPEDILVLGNLDPVGVFKSSNADQVYIATMKLLNETASYKNFIISSGCDLPPGVPIENVKAFFSAVTDFNDKLK